MSFLPPSVPKAVAAGPYAALLRHVLPEEIPADEELLSADRLQAMLEPLPRYDLLLLGDVMLGDKVAEAIQSRGDDYPFAGMLPLLRRCTAVVANLEAPFAIAPKEATERYSYRVDPALVRVLKQAGISAVDLANNHIMDCGRQGVLETLATLQGAGIGAFGGGVNLHDARRPLVLQAGRHRVGLVGYYWNGRCAATDQLPGNAVSDPEQFQQAIRELRPGVDFLVAQFHWGNTYAREPSAKASLKAHLAIDAGADLVIGHHPHILQPLELYNNRPIFYSLGNLLMGSGNSRAEGLAVALRLSQPRPEIHLFALYVKNRDPRVAYQSKVLTGAAARRQVAQLHSPTCGIGPKSFTQGRTHDYLIESPL